MLNNKKLSDSKNRFATTTIARPNKALVGKLSVYKRQLTVEIEKRANFTFRSRLYALQIQNRIQVKRIDLKRRDFFCYRKFPLETPSADNLSVKITCSYTMQILQNVSQ